MQIVKEGQKFVAIDVRNTNYAGSYQIIEKMSPYHATCGIYSNKKDLLERFNKLEGVN